MKVTLALVALSFGVAPALAEKPAAESKVDVELERWNAAVVKDIRQRKPGHIVISAAAAQKLRSGGMRILKLARVVPAIKDGKPAGFKVFAIRKGSVPAALGLRNGDTVDEINGIAVRDITEVMAAYPKVAKAKRINVRVRRKGAPAYLRIDIRK